MLGALSYRQGVRLRSRLLQIVCSSTWLDAIAPADFNGLVRHARRGVYPPGGENTAMRECPACRRISPPNSPQPICGDCEIEIAELAFCMWCAQSTRSQRFERQRRWWCSPMRLDLSADDDDGTSPTWATFVNNPGSVVHGLEPSDETTAEFVDEFSALDDDPDVSPRTARPDHRAAVKFAHRILGLPTKQIAFNDPIPRSSLSQLPTHVASDLERLAAEFVGQTARSVRAATTAFRRTCRSLADASIRARRGLIELEYAGRYYGLLRYAPVWPTRNVSIGSGRSAGCALTMLPESELALQREIAYAEAYGGAVPSAKRFTRSNPFRAAPEDALGLRALLGFTRSANEGTAARRRPADRRRRTGRDPASRLAPIATR